MGREVTVTQTKILGEHFSLDNMALKSIEVEGPERARLFQRCVLYETLSPMVMQGRNSTKTVRELCLVLSQHLSSIDASSFDDYMQAAVTETNCVMTALAALTGDLAEESTAAVRRLLDSKAGVMQMIAQAVSMTPTWQEKTKTFLKLQTAWAEHGPLLEKHMQNLRENFSLQHLEASVQKLPLWRDVLHEGSPKSRNSLMLHRSSEARMVCLDSRLCCPYIPCCND